MATPVTFLTDEVNDLLKQAEERLTAVGQVVAPSQKNLILANNQNAQVAGVPTEAKAAEESAKTKKKDNLTVRVAQAKDKKKDDPDDAGPDWYGLPKTIVTPEVKRDFQVLRMRGVIDTKHHFRKDTRRNLIPQFSVHGTVVGGGMEDRVAPLSRKERRQTIADEILASQTAKDSFKKRYNKLQEKRADAKKHSKRFVGGGVKRRR